MTAPCGLPCFECYLYLAQFDEEMEAYGSPVGVHIAQALKAFGMVNHTVWVASNGMLRINRDQEHWPIRTRRGSREG